MKIRLGYLLIFLLVFILLFIGAAKAIGPWLTLVVVDCHQAFTLFFIFAFKWLVNFITFGGAGKFHRRLIEMELAK